MRVLITGITGFVGSYLATDLLQTTDMQVFGIDRTTARLLPQVKAEATCFTGDMQSPTFVSDVLRESTPDVIVHLAGQASIPASWRNPWDTMKSNVLPQFNMLQSLVALGQRPRILSISSAKVYGATNDVPLTESAELQPDSPYCLSKVTQDLMGLQYFLSHQMPIIRVRPFNHIGPRQSPDFVTAAFARQIALAEAAQTGPVVQVGNLSAARDFTDVRDVIRAYRILMTDGKPGEAYNVGSGKAVTIQHILDRLISLSTTPIEVRPDPERMRPVEQPLLYADIRKMGALGWEPTIALDESLADILDYWRIEVAKIV